MSEEERSHAFKLMNYQNTRGGHVSLYEVPKPEHDDWQSLLFALQAANQLERDNTTSLMSLYDVAEQHRDITLMDFVTTQFLHEQAIFGKLRILLEIFSDFMYL